FQSLISSAENLESPNKINGFVDEINIELMEVAGIESETSIFIVANAPGQSTDKVIKEIKNLLSSSLEEYKNGNFENSYDLAVSAYLDQYEDIEGAVASKDNALNSKLESKFSKLRSQINSRADEEEINATISEINMDLDKVTKLLNTGTASGFLAFFNSLVIILREGIEAALVIGAVIGYLRATRNDKYLKHVYLGIGLALIATLVTWIIAQTIISISGASREMLEGITALIAVVVLFYVSYWLISKIEVKKWTKYIKSKVELAMTTGNILILASIAFFAVYREGFETVLFYQALWLNSIGYESNVLFGFIVGTTILLAVVIGILKLGLKIPLRTFFGITSAILYYLAFTFAGQGIHELQEAGVISETPLNIPEIGLIGMYPTLETLAAQMLLVLALLIGLVYVFKIQPAMEKSKVMD
ncbi:MAG: FTR1 family protein, partial [Methanosarcinales archaeon]